MAVVVDVHLVVHEGLLLQSSMILPSLFQFLGVQLLETLFFLQVLVEAGEVLSQLADVLHLAQ